MPSSAWRPLGPGSVPGFLRTDLRAAEREVWIVGPWIDDYFADLVLGACKPEVALLVLTRTPGAGEERIRAGCRMLVGRTGCELRILETVHAKVIVIDERLVYCGSTNWYRYSLEEAPELTLRGEVAGVPAILDEVASLWERGSKPDQASLSGGPPTEGIAEGVREEILDPITAAKLAEVPGSFVLGPRTARTARGKRRK